MSVNVPTLSSTEKTLFALCEQAIAQFGGKIDKVVFELSGAAGTIRYEVGFRTDENGGAELGEVTQSASKAA